MAARVFLHIGAPKSGTTYLQTILWRNRKRLAENGVLVPGRRPFDHNRAATAVRCEPHLTRQSGRAVTIWRRMLSQTGTWPGTVIFTNEWFVRATRSQAARAIAALQPAEVHLVFTARAFTELFPAAWQESLKLGHSHTMKDFAALMDDEASEQWSWRNLDPALALDRWVGDLPRDHVHVITVSRRASEPNLLWQRAAEVLGIDPDAYDLRGAEPNESLGAESARLLQRIGPSLRDAVDADTAAWTEQYRWLRRYVGHELLVPRGGSKIGLPTDIFESLHERSGRTVESIRAAGYNVIGDLDELYGGRPGEESRDPEDVTSDEMLDVAVPLVADLLRRVRDETERAERAERRATHKEEPARGADGGARGERSRVDRRPDRSGSVRGILGPAIGQARRAAGAVARRWPTRVELEGTSVSRLMRRPAPAKPRLCILMTNANGTGGRARTIINLANHLVDLYDIEIISLLRRRDRPAYKIDARIKLGYVVDVRPSRHDGAQRNISKGGVDEHRRRVTGQAELVQRRPSTIAPLDPVHEESSDGPLIESIERVEADILLGTTPSLNRFIGEFAPSGVAKIGQDHMNFDWRTRTPEHQQFMLQAIQGLDVFVTLTEADARDYRRLLPDATTRISCIPNALTWAVSTNPAPLTNKVVVAAGRLTAQKAFDRLIDAYAAIAAIRPDWRLDIYGSGHLRPRLRRRIDELGIGDAVVLQGFTNQMPEVLSASSIFAMSSIREGFPMVLLEAMSRGLPMVSYDCPRGPAEMIRDGLNGRLIPDGDTTAFTNALLQIMDDDDLRERMGAAALNDAHRYEMQSIVEQWTMVFAELGVPPRAADRR